HGAEVSIWRSVAGFPPTGLGVEGGRVLRWIRWVGVDRPEAFRVATAVADHRWVDSYDRRRRVGGWRRRERERVGVVAIQLLRHAGQGRINGVERDIGDAALHDDQRAEKGSQRLVRIRPDDIVHDRPVFGGRGRGGAGDESVENLLPQYITVLQGLQLGYSPVGRNAESLLGEAKRHERIEAPLLAVGGNEVDGPGPVLRHNPGGEID